MDDGIIYFELWDEAGALIVSGGSLDGLTDEFYLRVKENFVAKGYKNAYRCNNKGSVRIVVACDSNLFQGGASIKRACAVYLSLIPFIKQNRDSQRQHFDAIIRRFAHNLIKFQKRFKDNFSRLISDISRSHSYAEFKDEVERRIIGNTSAAANDVCQMSHRAIDLDSQIETLRILGGYADSTGSFINANLKKTMFRLTHPFHDELLSKHVSVNIDINTEDSVRYKVPIIHNLFNAAIWQLLDNICKYSLTGSSVHITADLKSNPKKLVITTTSICIDEDELEIVFLEGRRGRHVKAGARGMLGQEGTGIGLYIVKRALKLMKASICVTNNGLVSTSEKCPYCKHAFTITFSS